MSGSMKVTSPSPASNVTRFAVPPYFAVPVDLPGRGAADLYFLSFQDGDPPETGVPSEIGGGKKEKYL